MSANNKYSNSDAGVVANSGGCVRLTITLTVAQGPDMPCRNVFVQGTVGNTGLVRMNVGVAATTNLGIQIPEAEKAENGGWFALDIDNLNKLYFFGTNADTVDIMYLR